MRHRNTLLITTFVALVGSFSLSQTVLPVPVRVATTRPDTAAAAVRGSVSGGPLMDDFNDGSHDTATWTKIINITALTHDAAVTVTETGGRLVITPLSRTRGLHYNGYESISSFDFTDSAMQATLLVGGSTPASCEMGVKMDADNWAGFDAESIPPHDLYFLYRTTAGEDSIAIEYAATTMNYMRIRHVSADGSLRWETSGDGVTWTQRRSVSPPWAVSSMKAVVFGGTYQVVTSPGTCEWDDVQRTTVP